MDSKELEKTLISNSDSISLTAVLARLRIDPELSNATVKISDKSNFYQAVLDKQIISQGAAPTTYTKKIQASINNDTLSRKNYINAMSDDTLPEEAKNLIHKWVRGDQFALQKGATAYFARGYSKSGHVDPSVNKERNLVDAIYNSQSSKNSRAEFMKSADNGYIYLYRGTHTNKLKGSAPLESMTTDFSKANEFAHSRGQGTGRVNLYKIDVDDVVAVFKDTAGSAENTVEVMVRASARQAEVSMDTNGKILFAANQPQTIIQRQGNKGIRKVSSTDVEGLIRTQKVEEIDSLLANGIPVASIALRTNTPIEVVSAYISRGESGTAPFEAILSSLESSVIMDARTGNKIASLTDAEEALKITHKPIVLEGNLKKNPYVEGHAALNARAMTNINKEFTALTLAGSKSTLSREWGDYLTKNSTVTDMLHGMLGRINNQLAGNRFFNSADFFARNMGEVGPIMNAIGKQVQRMSNTMIGRVAEPIQNAMNTVSKDPAAVLEFATFKNLNDSLSEWRIFDAKKGQLFQKVEKIGEDGKAVMVMEPVTFQGKEFIVRTKEVRELISKIQDQSKELRDLHNTVNKIMGKADIKDIGLWLPTFNPVNKFIAYVHNKSTDATKVIAANNKQEYDTQIAAYRKYIAETGKQDEHVVEKGLDQELWSTLNGRLDSVNMQRADATQRKSGSAASAIVKADLGIFGEIIGGYEHYITAQTRNLVDVSLPDIGFSLDRLSALNQWGFSGQPLTEVSKAVKAPKDAAASMKNIMMGSTGLDEYSGWKTLNTSFETGLSYGLSTVGKVWNSTVAPLAKSFLGNKKALTPEAMGKMDYEKFAKELETKGIFNPYAQFDKNAAELYGFSKLEDVPDISKRLVYAGNALAATLALRVGDLAQPLVNIMSLPILTYLSAAQRMPVTFLGNKLSTNKVTAPQIMFEGARASNDPKWKALAGEWEKAGYFTPMISEANTTLQLTRALDKGAIAATERLVDSKFVEIMSKPADLSENFVRRQTMFTGAVLAKRLYPELDDAGVTIFARDFMDKAVGNFHAPQRPVFFQGTLGVALGLFQTYSLTLGQSIYRHLELKNYKVLGKAALTQSGIFGTGSLPGFNAVSNLIGEYFSDDHVDLTTGSYRALQDNVAESLLYGLPSQLGIGTNTRGDSNFRAPGLEGIVAVNFAKQAVGAVQSVANSLSSTDATIPQAFAEALSLQNISRPVARGAEIAMGSSITRQGNQVQTPEEVWTFAGVAARVLATRPMEEIKLRDAIHLKSFYGSVDKENRESLTKELKTRIRAGTLEDDDVARLSDAYLRRGGTPTGWRSALRTALAQEDYTGKEIFASKLKMDSPLNHMIDHLDGE